MEAIMRDDYRLTRRDLLKSAGAVAALTALEGIPEIVFADSPRMVKFPEKTDMILLTNRPPQLETPVKFFEQMITPNEAVFVRWHISELPKKVDLATWRLNISGNVEKELSLSMDDLRKFDKVGYTAVLQCSGNGRSFAEPRVLGGQWGNGAMANVTWAGARLKDILGKAGIKAGSVDISFNGLDKPPLPTIPDFVKSLPVDKALEDDIIVAYEMNGKELPMLNGFPARLIVPGWYGTYWVKCLSDITVLSTPFEGFWVKSAYRVPDTDCGCIPPGSSPKKTRPVTRMTTRTLVFNPMDGATLRARAGTEIKGLAFSSNYSIADVVVSVDGGNTWKKAKLGSDMGKYSWIQFSLPWKPERPGKYTIMAKATNSVGESQPFDAMWNPPGYYWNKVEKTVVTVR
jgi:sulfite dehydrogenase (cytochrome) subunit A